MRISDEEYPTTMMLSAWEEKFDVVDLQVCSDLLKEIHDMKSLKKRKTSSDLSSRMDNKLKPILMLLENGHLVYIHKSFQTTIFERDANGALLGLEL